MGKLRDSTGVILWILIGSFGLLWVVMDVFDPNALLQGPRALGSVNGEPIGFDEYNSRVQYYTNAYSQQTGSSMTPEMRASYESQVWDELVNQKLLEQKMDELGITVTDNEILDMAYGDNPDPLIRQYFQREDGSIDKFMIQNVLSDEQYSREAIAIELQLRQKRRQEKFRNFITAGIQVTDQDVQDEFTKRNSFAEISFVRFPYNEVEDSELTVTDDEIEEYYEENKKSYKREETYRASYVSFSTLPTSQDTSAIISEVEELRDDFRAAENDSTFLVRWQSTTPFNNVFVEKSEVREDYEPVLDIPVGGVTEVLNLGTSVAIIKKVAEEGDEIKFAVLSKIIEALPSTIDDQFEEADDFYFYATDVSTFEEEAEQRGLEIKETFASKGNNFISGLGQSQQVMDFFRGADEGDVSEPIELGTQFVVVRMDEKTEEGFRPLSEVRSGIETSVKNNKRKEITYNKVSELLTSEPSVEGLSEAAGKEIQSVDNLAATATVITGAGREPGIVGAVFAMEEGNTSKALKGLNAVYVVHVDSKTEPGASTLDEATFNQIRQQLEQQMNQRYLAVWLEELKGGADIIDNRDRLIQ